MKFLLSAIIILIPVLSSGQAKSFELWYDQAVPASFTDSVNAVSAANDQILKLQNDGFLLAYFSITNNILKINKGPQFQWAVLKKGDLPEEYLGRFGFENKFSSGQPFSSRQIGRLYKGVISRAENSGYPFAQIRLDSINIEDERINAVVDFNPGPYITFDSIKISGYSRINKKWLTSYLNIQQGAPFQEKAYRVIEDKFAQLPFLALTSLPEITFQNDEATVILNTKYIQTNKFDAIIGFAPKAGNNEGLLITGRANIELFNLFQRGHSFSLGWRSIRPQTQELKSEYSIPNILNSPVSLSGSADLFKQDSSFFNQQWRAELSIRKYQWHFGAFSKFFRSSVLQDKENQFTDVRVNYAGFSAGYNKKGKPEINGYGSIGAGNRSMEGADNTFNELQSEIQLYTSFKFSGENKFIFFEPSAHFIINNHLLTSDLIRMGGINSLRGYPENFFFVENYSLLRSEYHWVFGEESSFFALLDAAFMGNEDVNYAFGTGLGFDLKVNNGIFELIYAVGGYENVPVSFDRSVIHFGYKAIF